MLSRNIESDWSPGILQKISPRLLRLHLFKDFPLRIVLDILCPSNHKEELSSRLQDFVEQTDGRRLIRDPVEAREGSHHGEGGEVGGGE